MKTMKTMKKKEYIAPACTVYEIRTQGFIAKSPTKITVDDTTGLPTIGAGGTDDGGSVVANANSCDLDDQNHRVIK